jgi:clan AA aspartic protease (TIGR02281 family)
MATRAIGTTTISAGKKGKKLILGLLILGTVPGFILTSAFVALFTGEGIVHTLLSILLFIMVPFLSLRQILGKQERRTYKTLALWGAISWILIIFMLLGAREKTADLLSKHGTWYLSFLGKEKRKSSKVILNKILSPLYGDQGAKYSYEGGSIVVDVTVKGPNSSIKTKLILDTGASITTISSKLAQKLGLNGGSSSITVNTASGEANYPLVTINSIDLGGHSAGPITAAICDPCAQGKSEGLLGLNFTSQFRMAINNKKAIIKLDKLERWVDQKNDIEPFLQVGTISGDLDEDRLKISASISNNSGLAMKGLVFLCRVIDSKGKTLETKRVKIKNLKSHENSAISIITAPHQQTHSFQLELKRGFWSNP